MRLLAIAGLCLACATAPRLRENLSPLAWMVGDWSCEAKSLDTGSVEPVRIRFLPELGGAWIREEVVAPGPGKEPLFEQTSHLGLESGGRWVRLDVDSSGRFKLLHAETAGDSTLWSPEAVEGEFRERIERKGEGRWEAAIDVREAAAWTKAITWVCLRK